MADEKMGGLNSELGHGHPWWQTGHISCLWCTYSTNTLNFSYHHQTAPNIEHFGISNGDEKILKMAEKGREAGEHKSLRLTISFILLRLSKNSQL